MMVNDGWMNDGWMNDGWMNDGWKDKEEPGRQIGDGHKLL